MRRRGKKVFPAPPPTPEGKVWTRNEWGMPVLVDADKFQEFCKKSIGHLDELTPQERARVYETGELPDKETVQTNRAVSAFGIALARPK